MVSRIIASKVTGMVVGAFIAFAIGCEKSNVASQQNPAELTSPIPTDTAVKNDDLTTPFASPVQPNEKAGAPSPIASSADKSGAENDLVAILSQYAAADEETRNNIVEHLAEFVDKGADKADVAKALGSMFATEKSTDIKISILDELEALDPPSLLEQILPGLQSDQPLEVRDEAVAILRDLGDKRAIPALQSLLADPDDDIREEAQEAINSLNSLP